MRRSLALPPAAMSARRALIALHVAVLLFGFAGLFGKWLTLSPVEIVFGRTFVAALVLGVIALAQRSLALRWEPALALNGVLLALHWVLFFAAVQVATVAIGLLGFASFPVFVLLFEPRMRKIRAAEWATVLLVVMGLALLVPRFSWSDRPVQGLVLGLLSGVTFAMLAVRNRRLAGTHDSLTLALWQNVYASIVLLAVLLALPGTATMPTSMDLGLLLVLGALCTALAHTLFIACLRVVTAHTASVVTALEPVYGIALAAWLLAEYPDLRTLTGGAFILVAALLASRRALQ